MNTELRPYRAAVFVPSGSKTWTEVLTVPDERFNDLDYMDIGQKRASWRGLTKGGAGKVVLAWVTPAEPA